MEIVAIDGLDVTDTDLLLKSDRCGMEMFHLQMLSLPTTVN
jgi:hypothetical protein